MLSFYYIKFDEKCQVLRGLEGFFRAFLEIFVVFLAFFCDFLAFFSVFGDFSVF